MNIRAETLPAIAARALLATSASAQRAASRGEHKVLIEAVDPEGRVLTAQTVTFKSPGK